MGIGFLYPRGGGELESISVTTPPSTTSYVTGSNFNPTGMVVTAYYSDRSSRSITGYTYSPTTLTITDTAQSKTQAITITYIEGNTTVTTTTSVTVTNPVTSIAITTQPTNRSATVNSNGVATFNFSGAVVTATYTNGKTGAVTPTWSPTTYTISDTSTSKTVTVTATYGGKSTTTTMTASNPLKSIAITTQPSTRSYNVNSSGNCTFSFTGAKITATYTNGKTSNPTPSWSPTTASITDTTESKSVTVTASYGGKTATTTMTVNNPVTKITISPTSKDYAEGATTSATTTATLTNGKTKTVTATRNPATAAKGNTSCTFSYGGKSASQTMHVYKQIYTGSTPTTKTFQASSLTKVGSFYANTSNSNGEAGMAYLAISISGYKTIKVTWAATSGQYAIVYVGFKTSIDTTGTTWYIPSDKNSKYTFANGTSQNKSSQTTPIDCSSWSGTVYAHCHVYSGSTVSAVATSSITNITLWSS